MTIVKIQASLTTTNGVQQVLIYNRKKTVMHEGPISDQIKKLMGDKLKVYAKASCKNNEFIIHGLVGHQPW